MNVTQMSDLDLRGKRLLIREDFNVPLDGGKITDDTRIRAAVPTIQSAVEAGAAVILMAHLGRPKGQEDATLSLKPVAERLSTFLNQPVRLEADWLGGVSVDAGDVVLCENVRFQPGEKNNDATLAKQMASLGDIFVMDAFATAHRKEASTFGVIEFSPQVCAGPLLAKELAHLSRALQSPERPLVSLVGGAKVSSKLGVISALLDLSDRVIVGGGMANTFIAAAGYPIGKSLYEPDLVETAARLCDKAREKGGDIPIPEDVIVATTFSKDAAAIVKATSDVSDDDIILDIGPKTQDAYAAILGAAGTILWNGPVGVFEWPQFSAGTRSIAGAIAQSSGFSIAGGGDTIAAIQQFGVGDGIDYISTGGGAFLSLIEAGTLPAVAALAARTQ